MTHPSAIEPDLAAVDAMRRAWAHIAAPGSFFTGHERIAIAQHARLARGLAVDAPPLPTHIADAAHRVADDPASIRKDTVDLWHELGLERHAYVELVSVVARVVAMDSYLAALGQPPADVPEARPGEPGGDVHNAAVVTTGWVPTVGSAGAITALSALPAELESTFDLHGEFYLTPRQVPAVGDEPGRELTRPQMELVAARTSWLNECFY